MKTKKQTLLFLIGSAFILNLFAAQKAEAITFTKDKNTTKEGLDSIPDFFPPSELMRIGTFYYPEQWDKNQWERDLNRMARLGFDFTHFAEFSWAFLEPEEGRFDFTWLDHAVDLAARAGLKVVMCTPSLCPPTWMGEKYPEIYLVGSDGRRKEHGIRAHASITDPVYRTFVNRFDNELGKHYGND